MKGSICGIHASVYDPFLHCLKEMDAKQSRASLASTRPSGSMLSITKSKKFRPCLVMKANRKANFSSICLMATFGGADYDHLAEITRRLVRPVQHNHPSLPEASAIPVTPAWPRDPQWVICWENTITTVPSPWSSDVPFSVDLATVNQFQLYLASVTNDLMQSASSDRGLAKRLRADLTRWKKAHEAKGEGSIYSQAANGSRSSLFSTRSYVSSSCSASTSSLMSIPEVSEDENWDAEEVPTPTPTGTTFAGKLMKNLSRASRSSHAPRLRATSAKDGFVIQDPPMKQRNTSRVSISTCRSQSSGKNCWAKGPPAIRAM